MFKLSIIVSQSRECKTFCIKIKYYNNLERLNILRWRYVIGSPFDIKISNEYVN